MKKLMLTTALTVLIIPYAQAAQVHVCTDANGKKVFQQMPCNSKDKSEIRDYEMQNVGTNMGKIDLEQGIADRNSRQLDREIRRSEEKIRQYQQAMERDLNTLRNKKKRANNNLAGAQWEESISGEMTAVTAKWDSAIRTEQSRLDNLYAQRNK